MKPSRRSLVVKNQKLREANKKWEPFLLFTYNEEEEILCCFTMGGKSILLLLHSESRKDGIEADILSSSCCSERVIDLNPFLTACLFVRSVDFLSSPFCAYFSLHASKQKEKDVTAYVQADHDHGDDVPEKNIYSSS